MYVANLLTYYALLRAYVENENHLINVRLTWSLTINGFLFTAFGLVAGRCFELLTVFASTKPATSTIGLSLGAAVLLSIMCVIAYAGWTVSSSSKRGIVAANDAIEALSDIAHGSGGPLALRSPYEPIRESALRLPQIIGGGHGPGGDEGHPHVRAGSYFVALPGKIAIAWKLSGRLAVVGAVIFWVDATCQLRHLVHL
jgi:hypothetical protein